MKKPWEETWSVVMTDDGQKVVGIRSGFGEYDCDVVKTDYGFYPPKIEAARLIAAAPELYRALANLNEAALNRASGTDMEGDLEAAMRAARSALRAARGKLG